MGGIPEGGPETLRNVKDHCDDGSSRIENETVGISSLCKETRTTFVGPVISAPRLCGSKTIRAFLSGVMKTYVLRVRPVCFHPPANWVRAIAPVPGTPTAPAPKAALRRRGALVLRSNSSIACALPFAMSMIRTSNGMRCRFARIRTVVLAGLLHILHVNCVRRWTLSRCNVNIRGLSVSVARVPEL